MQQVAKLKKEIELVWPDGERAAEESLDALKLCDNAIRLHPNVPDFHVLKGCLIQLGPKELEYSLDDAEDCFYQAIKVDPDYEDAYRELGHFYHAVKPNKDLCAKYFALAKQHKT